MQKKTVIKNKRHIRNPLKILQVAFSGVNSAQKMLQISHANQGEDVIQMWLPDIFRGPQTVIRRADVTLALLGRKHTIDNPHVGRKTTNDFVGRLSNGHEGLLSVPEPAHAEMREKLEPFFSRKLMQVMAPRFKALILEWLEDLDVNFTQNAGEDAPTLMSGILALVMGVEPDPYVIAQIKQIFVLGVSRVELESANIILFYTDKEKYESVTKKATDEYRQAALELFNYIHANQKASQGSLFEALFQLGESANLDTFIQIIGATSTAVETIRAIMVDEALNGETIRAGIKQHGAKEYSKIWFASLMKRAKPSSIISREAETDFAVEGFVHPDGSPFIIKKGMIHFDLDAASLQDVQLVFAGGLTRCIAIWLMEVLMQQFTEVINETKFSFSTAASVLKAEPSLAFIFRVYASVDLVRE
jgi:hypothetical protein